MPDDDIARLTARTVGHYDAHALSFATAFAGWDDPDGRRYRRDIAPVWR